MALDFSLACIKEKDNYNAKLHSVTGEEYVVKFRINRFNVGQMTLEWKNPSSKHISASFFNENNKLLSIKNLYVEDGIRASIFAYVSNYLIVVNVVPGVSLRKSTQELPEPEDKNLVSTDKKTVVDTEFRKFRQLSTDMRDLLHSAYLTGDIVLTDGFDEIYAHKAILSARSSVFYKMFQHPMKENQENRVVIKDISVSVLWELLLFLYTGTAKLDIGSQMAWDLYVAADKYDVMELKRICATLLKSVDLHSVFDTLLLADLYSDELLKEAAMIFISNNYQQLKLLQTWENFVTEHQGLAIEIMKFILDKK